MLAFMHGIAYNKIIAIEVNTTTNFRRFKNMKIIQNLRNVLDLLDNLPHDGIHNKIFEIVENSIFDIEDMEEEIHDLECYIDEIKYHN
jgi:hypothetical protein